MIDFWRLAVWYTFLVNWSDFPGGSHQPVFPVPEGHFWRGILPLTERLGFMFFGGKRAAKGLVDLFGEKELILLVGGSEAVPGAGDAFDFSFSFYFKAHLRIKNTRKSLSS